MKFQEENFNYKTRYHTEAVELMEEKNHHAFFANKKDAKSLLIFLHGFNGSSVATWNKFPSLLCHDENLSETDIVFYGYPSLKFQASDHAGYFFEFLENEIELSPTKSSIKKIIDRKSLPERNYEKIIIAAHSLGAVVARAALLRANSKKKQWLNKTRMILFAPAHLGAHIDRLIFDTLDIFLLTKLLGTVARYRIPVLEDLKQGSIILERIKNDTEYLIKKKQGEFTKAKCVVHAPGDKVVVNGKFGEDEESLLVDGKTHSSICKPDEMYYKPISQIIELLKLK